MSHDQGPAFAPARRNRMFGIGLGVVAVLLYGAIALRWGWGF